MEQTLRQLGELLLGSVPTIVLFLVLYLAYGALVHKPLEKILSERRARTEGAMEKARADISAAEARTAEYESRLREARVGVFKAQEARRQRILGTRAAVVAAARAQADSLVKQNRAALAEDVERSKGTLPADAERLATEIISSILRQAGTAQQLMGGTQ
jgi:F-type H+-transporting ATPase subunit b